MAQDDPTTLSPDEARVLERILDEIVPPSRDGRLPGAGEIGLSAHIAAGFAQMAWLQPLVLPAVAALEALAQDRHGAAFGDVARDAQRELVREVDQGSGIVASLLMATYVGYYQHPRVLEALGHEARPPFPDGYVLEPFDPALLDPVRARPKRYREC